MLLLTFEGWSCTSLFKAGWFATLQSGMLQSYGTEERWSALDALHLLPEHSIAVSSMQRCRKVRINLQKIITY